MDLITVILGFFTIALYVYSAIYLYSAMTELGVSQRTRRYVSIFWLPVLLGVVTVFALMFCLFVIITPFVVIALLIDYSYYKITDKSLLFDGEKIKFEL